ncbi:MAG: helix-turn-helix domain-containing protein [Pedobacter sp.]|nr:MAG: helix-turn-helix domain-containing protein [Pedobacter sp.]
MAVANKRLRYFFEPPYKESCIITKERIIETVWGWDFDGDDNVLEVCMHGLREKIESKDLPKIIHTVRGIGYVIKSPL